MNEDGKIEEMLKGPVRNWLLFKETGIGGLGTH